MTLWRPGMRITDDRLNDGPDPVTTESGLILGAGFTLLDFRASRVGKIVTLDLYLHRTGADIVPATNGNVTPDLQVATAPDGWRPTNGTVNGTWGDGIAEGGFVIGNDGLCSLRTTTTTIRGDATAPTGNGSNLRFHIVFIRS
ncbi:hypothetical protein [Streptomyces phaeochromogenes]